MIKDGNKEYKFFKGYDYDSFRKGIVESDYEVTQVPCGNCIGCRLDYSRQWANRCYLESLGSNNSYFITLTYDEKNLPIGKNGNPTLLKDEISNFMKDLRAYYKYHFNLDNVRFFACGEYGDSSLRPHYHLIIFNLPIYDLTEDFIYEEDGKTYVTKHVENGNIYYYSDIIRNIWKKGNILIGQATWQSMAYVARYVTKKIKGKEANVYAALGVEPEYVRMSRRPGIGEKYFREHYKEIYENDNIIINNGKDSYAVQPPRYFDKLVDRFELSDIDLEAIKDYRLRNSEAAQESIYQLSNMSYIDYIESLADKKMKQIFCLKRSL